MVMIGTDTMADLSGRMSALLKQEESYRADDYLSPCRRSQRGGVYHCVHVEGAAAAADDRAAPPVPSARTCSPPAAQYRKKRRSHEISPSPPQSSRSPPSPSPTSPDEPPFSSVPRAESEDQEAGTIHEIPPSPTDDDGEAMPNKIRRSSSPSSVGEDSPDLPSSQVRQQQLSTSEYEHEQATLCQDWRSQMIQWQFKVTDSLSMSREIAQISASFLDRYLSSKSKAGGPTNVTRRHFQLVSMTCLYLATKLYDHKTLTPASIVNLSRGQFTPSDIESMERTVLTELQWKVSPATPLIFAKHFVVLLPPRMVSKSVRRFIVDTARYLTELSAIEYTFVTTPSSTIGLAATLTALDQTYDFEVDPKVRSSFERAILKTCGIDCDSPEVVACREMLGSIYREGVHRMTRSGGGEGRRHRRTVSSSSTEKRKSSSKRRRRHQVGTAAAVPVS